MEENYFEISRGVLKKYHGPGGVVAVPDGVVSIGRKAFFCCQEITEIHLPDSVKGIGESAFSVCRDLTRINIPEGVLAISSSTFSGCQNLTDIHIPNSVTRIEESAFAWCKNLAQINIPDGITEISKSTFLDCQKLQEIHLPDSVSLIESSAFYGCTKLKRINIPEGITAIKWETFANCQQLTDIYIPNSVTIIEPEAFKGCNKLRNLHIPDSVTVISETAFIGCDSLVDESGFLIRKGILYHYGGAESEVIIPDTVTAIGGAFYECKSITKIQIPSSVSYIGNYAFHRSSLEHIDIPNSVNTIGYSAFSDCYNLRSIQIPDSVTSIGGYSFSWCKKLTSVHLPAGITSISSRLFLDCTSLSDIHIPDSVTSIDSGAFEDCTNLTHISIPSSVVSIGERAFSECKRLTSVYIPEGVQSIGEKAFFDCENLKKIFLPNSLYRIAAAAFSSCSSLEEVFLPFRIKHISRETFQHCSSLKSIHFPNHLETIGDSAFWCCRSLTEIRLPPKIKKVGTFAFDHCTNVKAIYAPDVPSVKDGFRSSFSWENVPIHWLKVESEETTSADDPAAKEWLKKYGEHVDKNPQIDFNGTAFVFTGLGSHGSDAKNHKTVKAVIEKGGLYRSSVSGKTNYLVVDPSGAGASKIDAVIALRRQGKDIKVILLSDLEQILSGKPVKKPVPEVEQKHQELEIRYSEFTPEELRGKKVFLLCDEQEHMSAAGALAWCGAVITGKIASAKYIYTDYKKVTDKTTAEVKVLKHLEKGSKPENGPRFINAKTLSDMMEKAYADLGIHETDEDRIARAKRIFTKNVILLAYVMGQHNYGSPSPEGSFPDIEDSEAVDTFLDWALHDFVFPKGVYGFDDDGGDDIYSFRSWIAHYVARFVFEEQNTYESFYRDKWESRGDYSSDSKVCFMLDANCCPEGLVFVDDDRRDGLVFLTDTIMDAVAKLIPKEIL